MSFTVKDIINDAFDRSGVFPNPSDALPGEMADMGLKLLQGLVNTYNIRNYITCTQRMLTATVPTSGTILIAKSKEGEEPVVYDCTNINKVYLVFGEGDNAEFKYVAYMNYPRYSPNSNIYTWNQVGEYAYDLQLQPWTAGRKVIVCYNVPFECDKTTTYYLPPEYKELFTLGLCLKLLAVYPREDKTMYEQMADELQNLTKAIEAKQADSKMLTWNRHGYLSKHASFNSGSFLYQQE